MAAIPARQRGFTVVELIMGMVVTSLVLLAVAGLVKAVGDSWTASEDQQSVDTGTRQTLLRINAMLRSAKLVGLAVADDELPPASPEDLPGAVVMFWKEDTNNDGVMQVAEVALLEHDRATATMKIYEYTTNDAAGQTPYTEADISDAADRDLFKALPAVKPRVIAKHVGRVKFKASSSSDSTRKQSVELEVKLKKKHKERKAYGTATLRGPKRPGAEEE